MNDAIRDRRSSMERHLQTFLLAVSVGLVGWGGNKITTLSEASIRTRAAVESSSAQLRDLKDDMSGVRDQLRDFYLRSEAERVHSELAAELRRHDKRLLDLERQPHAKY